MFSWRLSVLVENEKRRLAKEATVSPSEDVAADVEMTVVCRDCCPRDIPKGIKTASAETH